GVTNALLTAIQTGVLLFLFPLYLLKRGGLGPEAVGFLISLSVLGRLVALWLGGSLSDRWGRIRMLIPGLLIYAAWLGTVARLTKEGREIAYVIVTNGNKGSADRGVMSEQLIPIREEEQRRAARVLGVGGVEFLGYEDGELEDTRNLRRDATREIRRWRPDLI